MAHSATLAFAGRQPDSGAVLAMPRQRLRRLGRAVRHGRARPVPHHVPWRYPLIPVEVHEASYPFMIESFELRADSGGPGEFRGGLGLDAALSDAGAACRISTRFERTIVPGLGMHGGHDGAPGNVMIERADGTTQAGAQGNGACSGAGDRVRIDTGGGGGFGDPRKRDRARVHTDVMRGYISAEAARNIYSPNDPADRASDSRITGRK